MIERQVSELDRWIHELREDELQKRLRDLDARIEEIDEQNRSLLREKAALTVEREQSQEALNFKQRWLEIAERVAIMQTIPSFVDGSQPQEEKPRRGKDSIRALLRQFPRETEWTAPRVLEELVKRGWAERDDTHAVQVNLSRMAREGELHRPSRGVYRLPPDEAERQGATTAKPLSILDPVEEA
jgi:predicted nuclease with TOPRIM domain